MQKISTQSTHYNGKVKDGIRSHAHDEEQQNIKRKMSDRPTGVPSPSLSRHLPLTASNGLREFCHAYECQSSLYLGANSQVWMVKQKNSSVLRVAKFLIPNASTLEIKILNFLKGNGGTIKLEDCVFNSSTNQYVLIFPFVSFPSPNAIQFTASDLKNYMYKLLETLAFCHGNQIVHCDLKPDNTMYKNGNFYLIDFGHAAMCHGNKASLTACNRYMAPELQQPSTNYDTAIDIWAAGVIFAEKIFNLNFNDAKEIYFFVKSANQPQNAEKMRQFPLWNHSACELVGQMLRWDPAHRKSAYECLQHPYFDECRIPNPNTPSPATLN